MIFAAIKTALAFLTDLPKWMRWAMLAALAVPLLWLAKAHYDASLIEEYERGVQEGILSTLGDAERDSIEALERTRSEVEQGNERARDAASKSDDSLGAAMRELRR